MILKHLPSFNVAVARLLRTDCSQTPAVVEFCHKFQEADDTEALPGINLHKVTPSKTRDVWSARASQEIRVILRKRGPAWYAAYVGHHDDAYKWAERNAIELPKTKMADGSEFDEIDFFLVGAAGGDAAPLPPSAEARRHDGPKLFDPFDDAALSELGVPHVMIPMLRRVETSDEFIDKVYPELPEELGDALFAALTGDFGTVAAGIERAEEQSTEGKMQLQLPRRTPQVTEEALQQLAESPDLAWAALPDAVQTMIAVTSYEGPILVTGAAGTGKTVVGVHRARHLASLGRRVLLVTYTHTLRDFLSDHLGAVCSEQESERITVSTVDGLANRLGGAIRGAGAGRDESSFDAACRGAIARLHSGEVISAFDCLIVDEAQDLGPLRLALVAAASSAGADGLTLLGDMDQRIYNAPFDLEDLGIDVGERIFKLTTAYRTTDQIMALAAEVLDRSPGELECTAYAHGPEPRLIQFVSSHAQVLWVALAVHRLVVSGVPPESIAVLASTKFRLRAYRGCLYRYGLGSLGVEPHVQVLTMHSAKGLEFDTVFVVDASDEFLPYQGFLQNADEIDGGLDDVLSRQRNLLHVAVTRSWNRVFVTWAEKPSRFLEAAISRRGGAEEADFSELVDFDGDVLALLENNDDLAENCRRLLSEAGLAGLAE